MWLELLLQEKAVVAAGVCAPENHHCFLCLLFLLPTFMQEKESGRELGTGAKSKLGLGANTVHKSM